MKNTIIVIAFVVFAGLAAMGYALTAGKSVSARIHGETNVEHVQVKPQETELL